MAAGCEFTAGGTGGACTGTAGVLSAHEISGIIKTGATVTVDTAAAAAIVTWNGNQWVSWDNTETLAMKVRYANERCLGGIMVWAIDLDDGTLIQSLADTGRTTYGYVTQRSWMTTCFGSEVPDWTYYNATEVLEF